jgi:hypothetical protein
MQSFHQDLMDCPNCGRRGLVRQSNDIYQCLCCPFRRNLSESSLENRIVWSVIILILAALLFGSLQTEESSQDSQLQLQSLNSLPESVAIWLSRST